MYIVTSVSLRVVNMRIYTVYKNMHGFVESIKQAGKELCHDLSSLLFLDNYLQIILASASEDVSADMPKINLNL